MNVLRWLRVIGDTIFAAGAVALGWFVLGLKTGWSLTDEPRFSPLSLYKPASQGGR